MNPDKLIKWRELSHHLAGSREAIRSNRIPKIHLRKINKLRNAILKALK